MKCWIIIIVGLLAGVCPGIVPTVYAAESVLSGSWRFLAGDPADGARVDFDDSDWSEQPTPALFETSGRTTIGWYRIRFDLPEERPEGGWAIDLGRILTADEVYLNGSRIGGKGRLGRHFVDAPTVERVYHLPDDLLQPSDNLLAVRVQSSLVRGGLTGRRAVLGARTDLNQAALERSMRRQRLEAWVLGLLTMVLVFWGLLFIRDARQFEYGCFGLLIGLLTAIYALESLLFYETIGLTPWMQRWIVALYLLLPVPVFVFSIAWLERDGPRRVAGAMAGVCVAMAALYLLVGGTRLCRFLEPAWLILVLSGGLVLLWHVWRSRTYGRGLIPAILLVGFAWFYACGMIDSFLSARAAGPLPFGLLLQLGFGGMIASLVCALALRYRRTHAFLRKLTQQLVGTQENERKRIAAELHNGIAPTLAAIKLDLQMFLRRLGQETAGKDMVKDLSQAIAALRSVSHTLRPAALDQLGLTPALRGLAVRLAEEQGWTLHVRLPEAESAADTRSRLPPEMAVSLYRMASEALYNIVRHAQAGVVELSLTVAYRSVTLRVADDGKGCNPEDVRMSAGLGWLTLRERAEAFGGRCAIRSQSQQGVEVTIWLPIP